VPVYQRSRGASVRRDQKYVDLLAYGNRNIGGGIDQFWLTAISIDPLQQSLLSRGCAWARSRLETEEARTWCRHPPSQSGSHVLAKSGCTAP